MDRYVYFRHTAALGHSYASVVYYYLICGLFTQMATEIDQVIGRTGAERHRSVRGPFFGPKKGDMIADTCIISLLFVLKLTACQLTKMLISSNRPGTEHARAVLRADRSRDVPSWCSDARLQISLGD